MSAAPPQETRTPLPSSPPPEPGNCWEPGNNCWNLRVAFKSLPFTPARLRRVLLAHMQAGRPLAMSAVWPPGWAEALLWQVGLTRYRLDETGAFVDVDEQPAQPIGRLYLAHPRDIPRPELARWGDRWGDYRLISPLPQQWDPATLYFRARPDQPPLGQAPLSWPGAPR